MVRALVLAIGVENGSLYISLPKDRINNNDSEEEEEELVPLSVLKYFQRVEWERHPGHGSVFMRGLGRVVCRDEKDESSQQEIALKAPEEEVTLVDQSDKT